MVAASTQTAVIGGRTAVLIWLWVLVGLALDSGFGWPGQLAAGAVTWAFLAWLFGRGSPQRRQRIAFCLLYATAGEVVLSLVWGLYEYRLANLPLFVPPGHVLLFLSGEYLARRMPRAIVGLVAALGAPWFLCSSLSGHDQLSLVLFSIWCVAACGRARRLYATMFLLALSMELYGTALGNWTWSLAVPGLPLSSANPPLAAGVFYSVLDLLVLGSCRPRAASVARSSGPSPVAARRCTPPSPASADHRAASAWRAPGARDTS